MPTVPSAQSLFLYSPSGSKKVYFTGDKAKLNEDEPDTLNYLVSRRQLKKCAELTHAAGRKVRLDAILGLIW
jgi:hypothetical protein